MNFINNKIWISVFISAALNFIFFELVFLKPNFFIWLGPLILVFNVLAFRFLYKSWSFVVLPLMFLVATFLFLPAVIQLSLAASHIFVVIILIIYIPIHINSFYLKLGEAEPFQKNLNYFLTLLVGFLWFSGFFNLFDNFSLELWRVIFGIILGVIILTWQSLGRGGVKMVHVFILALIMSEVCWGVSFLPFGYLTLGALLLIIYYVFWDILRNYLKGKLSKRIIIKDMLFAGLATILLLMTNPWLPM